MNFIFKQRYFNPLFFFLILLTSCSGVKTAFAQDYYTSKTAPEKAKKAYKESRDYAYVGDFPNSRKAAEKALKFAPNFIEALYILTDLDINDNNPEVAEAGFKKIIELAPDYKPKVHYSYGILLWNERRYSEAAENLSKFLTYPQKSESLLARATKFKENAEFAAKAIQNPVPFIPKNMGPSINTTQSEYWPSLSVDGQAFIFTRNVIRNEDFFVSNKKEGQWEKARNIGPPINTPLNEGAQTLSADGRFFAYTVCNRPGDYGKCDLYYSVLKKGKWTEPQNIGAPVNTNIWESQPSLSSDGRMLFFTRGTDNRAGNKDIWVSYRQQDDLWSAPVRLGDNVNTPFAEEAPFIHPDGKTLYFISNGHPGMGESDIYFSRRLSDGSWGKAENIGYPINTIGQELSIMVSLNGQKAYYASDREGGFGLLDIYEFDLPENARPSQVTFARAKVFDAETKAPLLASVGLKSLPKGLSVINSSTDESGIFLVCLPLGTDYSLDVEKEGYLFHSENFALQGVNTLENPFELNIGLVKIPVTAISEDPEKEAIPVILKNVFFESGSAELKPESVFELNQLKNLLDKYPDLNIRINGHTDNVGSDQDNLILSENRAKAVKDYLQNAGIAAHRLQHKGFGENQPIDTNDNDAGRANNRRTEFVIIK